MSQLFTKLARFSTPHIPEISSAVSPDMQWGVATNAASFMYRMLSVSERQFFESQTWAQNGRGPFRMMTPGQITLALLLMNTTLRPDRLPTELVRLTCEKALTQETLTSLRDSMKAASKNVDVNYHYLIRHGSMGGEIEYAALTTRSPVDADKVATCLGEPDKLRITPMKRDQLMALINSDQVEVKRLEIPQSYPERWAQGQLASIHP